MDRTIRYTGKNVTILWKPHLCIHSKKCWHGLPSVFKPGERPWITVEGAEAELVIDQVHQCPSGALSIAEDNQPQPTMSEQRTILEVVPNGPLLVKGTVEVKHADGRIEVKEEKCGICRCGASANKPFCDGSHRKNGFVG
jgi:uncharacterized Fe-S cluster protein YjdI